MSITELIVRLAKENRAWGYSSIDGALLNLGHDVGRSTIARVLKKAGIEPAPDRQKGMTWAEFLKTHWNVLAATDFFTAEVWTVRGLVRYHVLFVIRLATREVKIAGIVPEPTDAWMKQIARNLTDGLNGYLYGYRYLIHDRAPCFSKSFREILNHGAVKTIRLPRKSSNLNSFAERWVRPAKELCVDRMIFFGEQSLRHALAETETFYNRERPHQALGNRIIQPQFRSVVTAGKIALSEPSGWNAQLLLLPRSCMIRTEIDFWDNTGFQFCRLLGLEAKLIWAWACNANGAARPRLGPNFEQMKRICIAIWRRGRRISTGMATASLHSTCSRVWFGFGDGRFKAAG